MRNQPSAIDLQPRIHPPCPELPPISGAHLDPEGWEGPTLGELAERVEHQFGQTPALSGIYMLGFARDEPLTQCDIHMVCDLLGLPAEDFGVDV